MLNELRDKAYAESHKRGFYDGDKNLAEQLMLIVRELSEALEFDQLGKWSKDAAALCLVNPYARNDGEFLVDYKQFVKDSVEDELADVLIRIFSMAGHYNIDLDSVVQAKMRYNSLRQYKDKRYN
jgi:NTP pyrophosphatase (non-canonical NTP hydrolase)